MNENDFEKLPGGIFWAIIAASIRIVPEPHMGSIKFFFYPIRLTRLNPAANTSLKGASPATTL